MLRNARVLLWLVVLLAVGGAVVGIVLLREPSAPAPGSAPAGGTAAPPTFDVARAKAELDQFKQKFSAVIQRDRNPATLLPDARGLVERYPDYAPAHISLGQLLALTGDRQAGYEHLLRSLELNPKQPSVHELAGSFAMGMERYDDAERHYTQAVGLAPNQPRYLLKLATVQLKRNRYDDARDTLLKALALDSSLHRAHGLLADVFAQQNMVEPALDQLGHALDLLPMSEDADDARATYRRRQAGLLRRANRPQEALVILRAFPLQRLIRPDAADELAQTWMMLGKPGRAARHYEAILFAVPTAGWAAERAAHYRLEAGQPERAQTDLDALRRINPRAPQIPDLQQRIDADSAK